MAFILAIILTFFCFCVGTVKVTAAPPNGDVGEAPPRGRVGLAERGANSDVWEPFLSPAHAAPRRLNLPLPTENLLADIVYPPSGQPVGLSTYYTYSFPFVPTTTGANMIMFAFRQDPAYWNLRSPSVKRLGDTAELLINGEVRATITPRHTPLPPLSLRTEPRPNSSRPLIH